ncbi:zinc finger protein CONSTANS-LIKE 4-like isoform X2 [Ananas comosus]|uniref:Zinc finger protein CONSTANS-LIKE 4-like isoform X2 n=1 Tax=Ananas comosus TaxID=4615 RepID=A0A6P5GKK5_ANACO|nr:zinc finger protein CONSTANS-LIKE 4-like isoform X2 [Ananas comosus]
MDRGREKEKGKGKGCELCPGTARMYCESDEAMLCWECDARVHGANFLVARHTRALLCRTCQSPTPWRASGSRLGPSVSLCHRCSPHSHSQSPADDLRRGGEAGGRSESEAEEGEEEQDDDEDDGDGEDSEDSAEEEEGDNQVVPWSPPPPPTTTTTSSSSSEEEEEEAEESSRAEIGAGSGGGSGSSLKRMRDNADLVSHPQDDLPSSSLQLSRFQSAQPPPLSGRASAADDDDDEATSGRGGGGGGGGGSNSAGFRLPKDRRRLPGHLVRLDPAQPTGSTRRSQPTTAGEPCGPSRATIATIDFVQAT